jgi:hypothetical protein
MGAGSLCLPAVGHIIKNVLSGQYGRVCIIALVGIGEGEGIPGESN